MERVIVTGAAGFLGWNLVDFLLAHDFLVDAIVRPNSPSNARLAEHPHLRVLPYLYNMPEAMAMTDVAVFRAGATGLAELAARGVPAILIPYPYAAENHQEKNARAMETAGAAEVILNRSLDGTVLAAALDRLLADDARRDAMAAAMKRLGKPEAAEEIAALALRIGKREG